MLFQLDSEGEGIKVRVGCGIDSLLQTMIRIREMASDEITEDEMTQSFEKVENQNADCKQLSQFACVLLIFLLMECSNICQHYARLSCSCQWLSVQYIVWLVGVLLSIMFVI